MFDGHLDLIASLVATTVLLSLVLAGLVIAFKIRRDRDEAASQACRAALLAAWQLRDHDSLVAALRPFACAGIPRQSDLAHACASAHGSAWMDEELVALLRRAGMESGLAGAIHAQLSSPDPRRRGLAVVLGGYPVAQAAPGDLVAFTMDHDSTVRMAAIASLERLATDAAAQALVEVLARGLVPGPRIVERLGHPWAVPAIVTRLAVDDIAESVRCDLLRALALSSDPRALGPALEIVRDRTAEERAQALRAIAGAAPSCDEEGQRRAASAAVDCAQDSHAPVRIQAVAVLGALPWLARPDILSALACDPDWFVRRSAARVLARLGEPGLEALRAIASGPDPFAAARASEELSMAATIRALEVPR